MKKRTAEKLEEATNELNDIALQIVEDLDYLEDLGDKYSCFINKELYDSFRQIEEKICKLYEQGEEEDKQQLKLALK